MAGNSPWSVKGISPEERELAKLAARRAGVPIGRWLSEQIRSAANGDGRTPDRAPSQTVSPNPPPSDSAGPGSQAAPPTPAQPEARERRFGFGGFAQPAGEPPVPWRAPSRPASRDAADSAPSGGPHPAPRVLPEIDPARVSKLERDIRHLRDLEGRVEALQGVERRLGGLSQRLQQLAERVDDVEVRMASRPEIRRESDADRPAPKPEIPKELLDRVSGIEGDVKELMARPDGGGAEPVTPVTAPIERAVMRLSERLQRVEETTLTEDRPRRSLMARLFRRRR
ncbi:MAG: hypothetical protein NXI19_03515 [Alphaproteobacteria bacterium]|nr:hypothetical protein [Alphaproteobacteria bacterium]